MKNMKIYIMVLGVCVFIVLLCFLLKNKMPWRINSAKKVAEQGELIKGFVDDEKKRKKPLSGMEV